jgi:hypothetical protein
MRIEPDGYFIQGAWFKGLPPTFIGKKIIRMKPCTCKGACGNYIDYSYCLHGLYCEQPDEWVILKGITPNGRLLVEWNPSIFPGNIGTLEEWWNDGNWIEWNV